MNEFDIKLEAVFRRTESGRYPQVSSDRILDKKPKLPDLSQIGKKHTLRCPKCHAPEVNPATNMLFIRAYKVDNWSQCLVCAGYYDPETLEYNEANGNPKAGWFY